MQNILIAIKDNKYAVIFAVFVFAAFACIFTHLRKQERIIAGLEYQIDEKDYEIERLKDSIESLESRIEDLESRVDDIENPPRRTYPQTREELLKRMQRFNAPR